LKQGFTQGEIDRWQIGEIAGEKTRQSTGRFEPRRGQCGVKWCQVDRQIIERETVNKALLRTVRKGSRTVKTVLNGEDAQGQLEAN